MADQASCHIKQYKPYCPQTHFGNFGSSYAPAIIQLKLLITCSIMQIICFYYNIPQEGCDYRPPPLPKIYC
jgi:hypothetical protein